MNRPLGGLEAQAIAYAQMRGRGTLRSGELVRALRLEAEQEQRLLSRMARSGLIARVWRGLYLVPSKLPLGGKWSPGEVLAVSKLMRARDACYQICGPNAFQRYGLDEQVPNCVYVYNDKLSGRRKIGAVELVLIRTGTSRLGSTEVGTDAEGNQAVYSSRPRTLVDAVYDWSRFNSLPRGYRWIRSELATGRVAIDELVQIVLRFGDRGTIRRIGLLLERLDADEKLLQRLDRKLTRTTSPIPWLPGLPKRGPASKRWGIVVNGEA